MGFEKQVLKNRIQAFINGAGGITRASLLAADMMTGEISGDFVKKQLPRLDFGKIHLFRYDPKYKDELAYYDRRPLVLCLGPNEYGNDLGVNLHFLPKRVRWRFLDAVHDRYKSDMARAIGTSKNALEEAEVRIAYNLVEDILVSTRSKAAIRSYIPSRRTDTTVVSFRSWEVAAVVEEYKFVGASASKILALAGAFE